MLTTLAASFIWGINTLFLLDAGLTNTEAFAANAFFAVGTVIFEVPTGVIADTRGRRFSFLLGAATLLASTVLYLVMWQIKAPFLGWAAASAVLGLGFTFFSGATEAWLVDALGATGFTGSLESVFGRAQTVGGAAMLVGSVAGGVIAQATDLGVPYLLRAGMLGVTLIVAWWFMRDIGFTPRRGAGPIDEVKVVVRGAVDGGLRNPPVRWLMLAGPFTSGVGFFAFYAMQPYLLELYGDSGAYSVAGLAAAIVAGAQIVGGLIVPRTGARAKHRRPRDTAARIRRRPRLLDDERPHHAGLRMSGHGAQEAVRPGRIDDEAQRRRLARPRAGVHVGQPIDHPVVEGPIGVGELDDRPAAGIDPDLRRLERDVASDRPRPAARTHRSPGPRRTRLRPGRAPAARRPPGTRHHGSRRSARDAGHRAGPVAPRRTGDGASSSRPRHSRGPSPLRPAPG